jgi:hypothetical protein
MMTAVMRMERISLFDNATPEVLKNPFQNIQQFVFYNSRPGLTPILKHGKNKRNSVLLDLKAGVAQW